MYIIHNYMSVCFQLSSFSCTDVYSFIRVVITPTNIPNNNNTTQLYILRQSNFILTNRTRFHLSHADFCAFPCLFSLALSLVVDGSFVDVQCNNIVCTP